MDASERFYGLDWKARQNYGDQRDDTLIKDTLKSVQDLDEFAILHAEPTDHLNEKRRSIFENLIQGRLNAFEKDYQENGETSFGNSRIAKARGFLKEAGMREAELQSKVNHIREGVREKKLRAADQEIRSGLEGIISTDFGEKRKGMQQLWGGVETYFKQYIDSWPSQGCEKGATNVEPD